MTFAVGQPVWAIGALTENWYPGEILAHITTLPVDGYLVELGPRFPSPAAVPTRFLRPRDPDQHTPVTDVLELEGETVSIILWAAGIAWMLFIVVVAVHFTAKYW